MAKRIYIFVLIIFILGCSPQNENNLWDSYNLKDAQVSIFKNEKLIFKSPPELNVKQVIFGDFNNDGNEDFGLSLWKRGNYGNAKPFWVEENDDSYKMHLFLYTWDQNKIRPLWHSSNLPKINMSTKLIDYDKNGKNELLVFEKDYDQNNYSVSIWSWNGWGFELTKRLLLNHHFSITAT